jgi:hypothetical protein
MPRYRGILEETGCTGADKSLALYTKQAMGLKTCIYSTYSPLSSAHLWLCCSNFFNPSKKNYFGCAANNKIWNKKSQRLISTPTYCLTDCSFPILDLVTTKIAIFWTMTLRCPIWVYWRFGGKYYLHLQESKSNPRKQSAPNKLEQIFSASYSHLAVSWITFLP